MRVTTILICAILCLVIVSIKADETENVQDAGNNNGGEQQLEEVPSSGDVEEAVGTPLEDDPPTEPESPEPTPDEAYQTWENQLLDNAVVSIDEPSVDTV